MGDNLAQAIETLKKKEWIDLTHTFGPDSPHFSAFDDAEFTTLFNHDDGFFAQQFSFSGQYGTHIDAPIHFVRNQRYVHELGLKELILPLIVINTVEQVQDDPNFTLSVNDILAFEKTHGKIDSGTFVALQTNWSKRWPSKEKFNNQDANGQNQIPGWSIDALKFLFEERQIKAVGHETFDTDSSLEFIKNGELLGEYYVLEQDTFQVELLTNLDQVPTRGAYIANIVAKPDKASGFPIRSFAILP